MQQQVLLSCGRFNDADMIVVVSNHSGVDRCYAEGFRRWDSCMPGAAAGLLSVGSFIDADVIVVVSNAAGHDCSSLLQAGLERTSS
jgi:hypothetical protein